MSSSISSPALLTLLKIVLKGLLLGSLWTLTSLVRIGRHDRLRFNWIHYATMLNGPSRASYRSILPHGGQDPPAHLV